MVNWWSTRWKSSPHKNEKMNGLELDLRADFEKLSPIQAALDAVDKIVKKYPPPYHLYASGGIDSQVMILAWKKSGNPFSVIHYSYNTENKHDTQTLIKFCNNQKIKFEIRFFDARKFITSSELITYAKKYDCASPQILTYIKITEKNPATVIMSGNYIDSKSNGINYTILGLDRFRQLTKRNFVPFFLMSTPNLAYAFRSPEIFARTNNKELNSYEIKCFCYRSQGFDIIPQSQKFTGFEQIKESFDGKPVDFQLKLKYSYKPSNRPFDFLYRYALHEIIGDYSEEVTLLCNH